VLAILEDEGDDRFGQGFVATAKPGTTVLSRPRSAPLERRVDLTSAVEELELLAADPRVSVVALASKLGQARQGLTATLRWGTASYEGGPAARFDAHDELVRRLDQVQAAIEARLGRRLSTREAYVGVRGMGGDPIYEQTWGPPQRGARGCRPASSCQPVVVQQGCCPGEQQPSWPWSWNELDPRPRSVPGYREPPPFQPPPPPPQPPPLPPPEAPEDAIRLWETPYELVDGPTGALPGTGVIPFGPEGYLDPRQAIQLAPPSSTWEPDGVIARTTMVDPLPMPAILVSSPAQQAQQYRMPQASAGGAVFGPGGGSAGGPAVALGGGLMGFLGRLFGMGGGEQQDALAARAVLAAGGPGSVLDRLTPLLDSGGGVQVEAMQVLTQGGGSFSMEELRAIADYPAPWAAEVAAPTQDPLPPLGLVGERF
jgi:hypothetical protein